MQKLIDKALILAFCLLAMSLYDIEWFSIAIMLFAVAVSSICGYFDNNRYTAFLCVVYIALCLFVPGVVIFLPLIVYDCAGLGRRNIDDNKSAFLTSLLLRFCWIIALPVAFITDIIQVAIAIILTCVIAVLLQYRTDTQIKSRDKLFALSDSAKERAAQLERKNRDLMEKQDYEIRLATLAERNRIAREIHDNVGHMLTRSLLQISALRVTHTENGELGKELDTIKSTLSDAMGSIRSSVHDLHDESIDLESRLRAMIEGFIFCPVKLRHDAGEMPVEVKLCFAAIVREALSNIAKHSNATDATITLMEHPSFYQLVITDNGDARQESRPPVLPGGIGLQSMEDRITALGGVFRTEHVKGFKVFITVPKDRG